MHDTFQRRKSAAGCCIFLAFVFVSSTYSEDNNPQLSSLLVKDAFQKGVNDYLSRDLTSAEKAFRHCLEREPSNAEYMCWLAQSMALILAERAMKGATPLSLLPDGRAVNALYDRAMEIDPRSQRARIGHAVILRDIPGWLGGSVKKAEEILRGVLKDNPNNLSALHYLGTLYIKNHKKYEEGIGFLQKVIDTAQTIELTSEERLNLARTHHALGNACLIDLSDPVRAIPHLEKSLEIDARSPVAMLDLSEAYRQAGRTDDAKTTLRQAADIIQKNDYKRFKNDLAKAARKLGMKKELGS